MARRRVRRPEHAGNPDAGSGYGAFIGKWLPAPLLGLGAPAKRQQAAPGTARIRRKSRLASGLSSASPGDQGSGR